jgi:arylsulfatase A-like enzyme
LPRQVRQFEVPTALVTDADAIADHVLSSAFDEIVRVPSPHAERQADDWQATQLAAFFAAAIDVIQSRRPPGLIWLHTGALGSAWDSPSELRAQYAAADDPEPPTLVQPPSLLVADNADADFLLGFRHAYAGEVSVFDFCLNTLLETIAESAWRDALFMLTAPRSFPLGEHGIVGPAKDLLYSELLRVPCLVRKPVGPPYGAHSHALTQPIDLFATVNEWIASANSSSHDRARHPLQAQSLLTLDLPPGVSRELAVARAPTGETALMTAAWFARSPASGEQTSDTLDNGSDIHAAERPLELFVKPDDFFEVNEISDRCLEVGTELREIVELLDRASRQGFPFRPSLSDALVCGIESSRS